MESFRQVEDLAKSFSWSEPSWSLFIILGWLAFSVLYALSVGRGRILALLLAVYAGKLIVLQTPLDSFLGDRLPVETPELRLLAIFSGVFVLIFLALSKHGFKLSAEGRGSGIVFGVIFSVLQMGLLVSTVLAWLPGHIKETLAPLVAQVFLSQGGQVFWLVAPIVFLVVLGRFVANRQEG